MGKASGGAGKLQRNDTMISLDLLGIFGGGLLTFVTPCVLPLVPVYLAALTGGTVQDLPSTTRLQLFGRAVLFSAGLVLVFSLMGLAASSVGGLLVEYRAHLMTIGGLLILLFGLKFLGLIQIPVLDRVLRGDDRRLQTRFGWLNALLMGVLFAAGWSPCVGPILGSVLTYTASNAADPFTGAAYLALYGFGFALPLLVTAVFAGAAIGFLRRINPHLPKIERAVGVLLVVVAATFLFGSTGGEQAGAPHLACGPAKPQMIEIYSETCPICQEMKPVVRGMVNQCRDDEVTFRSLNVRNPQNEALVAKYRVVGVPTYVFVDEKGQETARLVGRQTSDALAQALSTLVGRECPGVAPLPAVMDEPAAQEGAACGAVAAVAVEDGAESGAACAAD